MLYDCVTHGDKRLFSGGKFTEVSVGKADRRSDFFSSQTLGRTGGGMDASLLISSVFFSSYKLPKTVTVTTLLLFGHGNVALWDMAQYVAE